MLGLLLLAAALTRPLAHHKHELALPQQQELSAESAQASAAVKAADDAADKTIKTVVKLLSDMLTTSKKDGETERKVFAKFNCWCDSTKGTKTASITNLTLSIETMEARFADLEAMCEKLSEEITGLTGDMHKNEKGREAAATVRADENADFGLSESDMDTGVGSLDQAINMLRAISPESFLQKADAAARVEKARKMVTNVAVLASARQRVRLSAWVNGKEDGGIIGVLVSLNDTLSTNLDNLRKAEASNLAQYNSINTLALGEHAALNTTNSNKKAEKAGYDAEAATTRSDLTTAKAQKLADETFLSDTTLRCSQKSDEYAHRQMLRATEESAIAQAVAILNSDDAFGSFQDVDATKRDVFFLQVADPRPAALSQVVHAVQKSHSVRLGRVAQMLAAPTPFDKVLQSITDMIGVIDKEEALDQNKVDWCDAEQTGNGDNKAAKETALAELGTTNVSLIEAIATARSNIATTEESLATNAGTQATLTATREAEHAAFVQTVSDCDDAEAILDKAVEVLEKFYAWLQAHEGPHTYTKHSGKDTPPTWNLGATRLAGKTEDELETACSLEPKCLGFSTDGWLKAKAAPDSDEDDQLLDSSVNDLFVKTFEDDALDTTVFLQTSPADVSDEVARERGEDIQIHDGFTKLESDDAASQGEIKKNKDLQALVQTAHREEPEETAAQALRSGGSTAVEGEAASFEGAMDGQKEDGGKAVGMLKFIRTETITERTTAQTDEQDAQDTYDGEMTTLTGEQTQLQTDLDTYNGNLASSDQSHEETDEEIKATKREHAAIVAFLASIEPGCTFIQTHYDDRKQSRIDEKTALEGVTTTLKASPAFTNAGADTSTGYKTTKDYTTAK